MKNKPLAPSTHTCSPTAACAGHTACGGLPLGLDTLAGLGRFAAALGLSALLATPAMAQAGAACNPQGSVAEVNACAVREFQQADTDLQVLYGDVMRIQSAHERPTLRKEQTAWMREREARCQRETAAHQARPEWPRLLHECLTRETRARRAGIMRWMGVDTPVPIAEP